MELSVSKLNKKQKEAFELLKSRSNIFISGQAGTGKSYLVRVFIDYCKKNNIVVGVTSTTGVSATLIEGYTLHSYTGILLGKEDKIELLERVRGNDKAYKRWLYTNVLIIDEVSMLSPELLEKLDYIGKKIRKSTKPFGGIHLIFVGDMYQLPPVKSTFCFTSPIWDHCIQKYIELEENMRQTDPVFQNILKEVRVGETSEKSIELLQERIGANIDSPNGIKPTKLFSHRAEVAKINIDSLMAIVTPDNPLRTYNAKDNVKRKDGIIINNQYRDNYLARIDKIFQAVKKLDLCIGAQVMLLYNLDVKGGLANGSRCVVIGFKNDLPVVRFMNGVETPVDYVSWSMKVGDDIIVSRRQIPLLLAYAVTVHKSQGSTLDCAQIDLGMTIFTVGQAYTALSRVKSLDALSIVTFDPDRIMASPLVVDFYNKIVKKELIEPVELDPEAIPDNKLCNVCMEREKNCVLLNCGHVCCCLDCSYNLETCPICRSDISNRNKIYI